MPEPRLHIEAGYRNGLERGVAQQLSENGIEFAFEKDKLPYSVPARKATYLLDFGISRTPVIIETKGWFGMTGSSARERQKYVLIKEQHPEVDLRFVFSNAQKKIYKGSKTTYAKWADDHGFKWADKGVVPPKWIEEIKEVQSRASGANSGKRRKQR